MPESMPVNALLLSAATLASICGLAWLALTMEDHWRQVRTDLPSSSGVRALRVLGIAALVASLLLCFTADHPTMAALVWVMSLALGALIVAFMLAWRPRALGWLVAFVRRG